jgi:hypothetical protein
MTPANSVSPVERWLCANCHCQLAPGDRYCAQCGQSVQRHVPTLFEFAHEFLSHYIALERGVLWSSLAVLFLRPGRLALEYFAGRRQRYVPPLRLYLTASILFFVAIKLAGPDFDHTARVDAASGERVLAIGNPKKNTPDSAPPSTRVDINVAESQFESWGLLEPVRLKTIDRFRQIQAEAERDGASKALSQAVRNFVQSLYYAMFLMLPIYAALLKLAYLDRGRTYGEHVVVGLYLHAMVFFVLLALYVVPWPLLQAALVTWMLAYPYVELRRVYGGSRWGTFWRANAIALLYLVVSGPVIAAFFLYAVIA